MASTLPPPPPPLASSPSQRLVDDLLPWLHVLRDTTAPQSLHARVLTERGRPVDPRTFEALELLALLGEIDYDAWQDALHVLQPLTAPALIESSRGRALVPHCELDFFDPATWFTTEDDWELHVDMWLARVLSRQGSSECYHAMRCKLEELYAQREQDQHKSFAPTPVPREQLHVSVSGRLFDGEDIERLEKAQRIAKAQQKRDTDTDCNDWAQRPLLRVETIDVRYVTDTPLLAREQLRCAARLADCGVRLASVNLMDLHDDVASLAADPVDVAADLQSLLGTQWAASTTDARNQTIHVAHQLGRRAADAIYSALASSQSTESVAINPSADSTTDDNENRRHVWHWIACTFFCRLKHAPHASISSLRLSAHALHRQDVASVQELLLHPAPLSLLLPLPDGTSTGSGEDTDQERGPHASFITASRFYFSADTLATGDGFGFAQPCQRVRVLTPTTHDDDDGDAVRVLLPGVGQAWVRRCDIIQPSAVETTAPVREPVSPPCDTLAITDIDSSQALDTVLALLRLVGKTLTTLTLVPITFRALLLDEWMLAVLEQCPQLTRLQLYGGSLQSLDTLALAFERGLCRNMTQIHINQVCVADASQAATFFHKLDTSTTPPPPHQQHAMTTQRLTVLQIAYCGATGSPQELSAALQHMVRANRSLCVLDVSVSYQPQPGVSLSDLKGLGFVEAGVTPVSEREQPLALQAKLAFLSVVSARAGRELDQHAVALVFEFAAECFLRRVDVEFKEDEEEYPLQFVPNEEEEEEE